MGRSPELSSCKRLRIKHFHGVSSGSQHEPLLKSRYGKVSNDSGVNVANMTLAGCVYLLLTKHKIALGIAVFALAGGVVGAYYIISSLVKVEYQGTALVAKLPGQTVYYLALHPYGWEKTPIELEAKQRFEVAITGRISPGLMAEMAWHIAEVVVWKKNCPDEKPGFDHRIGHFRPLKIIGGAPNSPALHGLGASTGDRSRWGGRRHDQGQKPKDPADVAAWDAWKKNCLDEEPKDLVNPLWSFTGPEGYPDSFYDRWVQQVDPITKKPRLRYDRDPGLTVRGRRHNETLGVS
jgi:hypothetical protein